MTRSPSTRSTATRPPSTLSPRSENDWRLFLRLLPYARRNRRLLLWALVFLVPSAIAATVQPVLIGQAVSLVRQESTVFGFLKNRTLSEGLSLITGLLLLTMLLRLVFDASQGYLVQKVGQRVTADIRNDLFVHVTSLAVRFFDRTPVGKLITRMTSDVDALGEVFSSGAIGIASDLFSMLTITVAMFLIQWELALLLLVMLIPITVLIIYFQQQFRQANYKAREELSSLNSILQENIMGIGVVQLFRREQFNAELFAQVNQRYIKAVDRTILYDSAVSATLEWVSLAAIAGVFAGLTVQLRPTMGVDLLLPLFAAVILGGIGSVWGAVLGGFIVGLAESASVTLVGAEYRSAAAFAVLIAILMVRPRGLFGESH